MFFASVRKRQKRKGLQVFWNARFATSVRKQMEIKELKEIEEFEDRGTQSKGYPTPGCFV